MASPAPALAGAWTLDAGEGVVIVSGSASNADRAFDGRGRPQSTPLYSKDELQALIEYGITDRFTLMLAPSLQHVALRGSLDTERTGLGYAEIGGRARLSGGDSWVLSAQSTLRIPGTSDGTNVAAIGYTEPEVDVRGLFGFSFAAGAWPAFVDVQVAQRFRIGGPPDEFRADVTLGVRPHDRWLFLLQSFNVISEGAGTWGYPSYAYHKAQLSAVYAVTSALSLQLGGYTAYRGRNALQENGLVLGAWYKF